MSNTIFYEIPDNIISQAKTKVDEVMNILAPYFISLSSPERQALANVGSESIDFLELSYGLAVEYPDLFPDFMKEAAFKKVFFITRELRDFTEKIDRLQNIIHDTEMLASDCALDLAMDYYKTIKIASQRDLPGARSIYDELKMRFPPRNQRKRKVS